MYYGRCFSFNELYIIKSYSYGCYFPNKKRRCYLACFKSETEYMKLRLSENPDCSHTNTRKGAPDLEVDLVFSSGCITSSLYGLG